MTALICGIALRAVISGIGIDKSTITGFSRAACGRLNSRVEPGSVRNLLKTRRVFWFLARTNLSNFNSHAMARCGEKSEKWEAGVSSRFLNPVHSFTPMIHTYLLPEKAASIGPNHERRALT